MPARVHAHRIDADVDARACEIRRMRAHAHACARTVGAHTQLAFIHFHRKGRCTCAREQHSHIRTWAQTHRYAQACTSPPRRRRHAGSGRAAAAFTAAARACVRACVRARACACTYAYLRAAACSDAAALARAYAALARARERVRACAPPPFSHVAALLSTVRRKPCSGTYVVTVYVLVTVTVHTAGHARNAYECQCKP
jgi:hypothetical protein